MRIMKRNVRGWRKRANRFDRILAATVEAFRAVEVWASVDNDGPRHRAAYARYLVWVSRLGEAQAAMHPNARGRGRPAALKTVGKL